MRLTLAAVLYSFDISERPGGVLPWEKLRTFLLVEKLPLEVVLKARDS
jgi:hypothetical protein